MYCILNVKDGLRDVELKMVILCNTNKLLSNAGRELAETRLFVLELVRVEGTMAVVIQQTGT